MPPRPTSNGKVMRDSNGKPIARRKKNHVPPSNLKFAAVELGDRLETVLGTDYLLAKQNVLVKLRAEHTLQKLVDDYVKYLPNHHNARATTVPIEKLTLVAKGLCDYMDMTLEPRLLYSEEKAQFADYKKDNGKSMFRPSAHYGLVHCTRLLANFPNLAIYPQWEQLHLETINHGIQSFADFLRDRCGQYYKGSEDYENVTEERFAEVIEEWHQVKPSAQ